MLEFSHDVMNMLPSILVLHVGRVRHKMAQTPEVNRILPMKAITANTPGVPSLTRLVLSIGVLLPVAAFPARLRVVILKRMHPQPQSDNRSDNPEKRGHDTPTLDPHSRADGEQNIDNELEKTGEK